MATAEVLGRSRAARFSGSTVGLLALFVFINYVDRGNLSTAAPLIKDQLKLSDPELGLLLAAFFWAYTPAQFLAGWLGERLGGGRALSLGNIVWSVSTVASGLCGTFAPLLGARLALGVGESVAFPCTSKLLGRHLPPERQGRANGLILAAMNLGPAVGTFAGGLFMARFGWRALFVVFGLASALWLPLWLARQGGAREFESAGPAPPAAVSYRAIASRRELWGVSLAHFSANYFFYFWLSWLPFYLVKARGFTVSEMASLVGLLYLVMAGSALLFGHLYQVWMARGASATRAGKMIAITGHVASAAGLAVCAIGGLSLTVVSLFFTAFVMFMIGPMLYASGQTLAGPANGGKWMTLQNFLGNLAGLIAPALTGFVIGGRFGFAPAFIIAAGAALIGVIGWAVLIRKIAPLEWGHPTRAPAL